MAGYLNANASTADLAAKAAAIRGAKPAPGVPGAPPPGGAPTTANVTGGGLRGGPKPAAPVAAPPAGPVNFGPVGKPVGPAAAPNAPAAQTKPLEMEMLATSPTFRNAMNKPMPAGAAGGPTPTGAKPALPPMLQEAVAAGRMSEDEAYARGVKNRPKFAEAVAGAQGSNAQGAGAPSSAGSDIDRMSGARDAMARLTGGGLFSGGAQGVRERLRQIVGGGRPDINFGPPMGPGGLLGGPGAMTTPPQVDPIPPQLAGQGTGIAGPQGLIEEQPFQYPAVPYIPPGAGSGGLRPFRPDMRPAF